MDGRMSSSASFDAELKANLDMLQTPPDRAREVRRFGARFRGADARHDAHSSSSSSSITPAFSSGSARYMLHFLTTSL